MKKSGSLKSYNPRKSKKHIFFFNVLPVAVAAAVLLGIAGNSAFQSVNATAKTSLPYIETKKSELSQTGGSFHILEVTPEKDNALYRTTAGGGVSTSTSADGKATEGNYDAVTGNFGYLIAGQEPINFDETLGYFGTSLIEGGSTDDELNSTTSESGKILKKDGLVNGSVIREIRSKWANEYLNALKTAGIASDDKDAAPLQLTKASSDGSYYQELKPWDNDVDGEKTINLNSTETVYVTATATPNSTDGSYSASASSYTVNANGDYVQNISLLNPLISASSVSDADMADYVFYQPVFTKVDFDKLSYDDVKGDLYTAWKLGFPLIFTRSEDSNGTDIYSVDQLATGNFSNLFAKDEASFKKALKKHTFDSSKDYYVITGITGTPVLGSSSGMTLDQLKSGGYYAAKLDTEIPYVTTASLVIQKDGFYGNAANGFFSCDPHFFNYVGKGQGSYDLTNVTETTSDNTNAIIINYSIIRYVGGYKNNNWFLKHTLDIDDDKADSLASKVYVDYVTPDKVTENSNSDGQSQNFSDYDLVVLSGGIDLFSDSIRYRSDDSYSKADCTALTAQLKEYLDNKGPVLVDSSALANSDINKLLSTKEDDTTYKYMDMSKADNATDYPYGAVYRSVYVFRDAKALASDQYINNFNEDQYKEKGSAFYDVYNEIMSENALRERKNPGTTDKLDAEVDEATAIRYIINYTQQRNTAKKSTLKVLDIEPESITQTNSKDEYTYYNVSSGTAKSAALSDFDESECKAAIEKCLPDIDAKNINVTTVSTRTLAGLTDDIT
ncbi:MAG: hypothetical protein ACI4CS_08005, partial [Candidatus Weimeria sp.]